LDDEDTYYLNGVAARVTEEQIQDDWLSECPDCGFLAQDCVCIENGRWEDDE
jgi:hypothetical protein